MKYLSKMFGLASSQTAKDTYVLFVGNIISAFLGFLFILLIARALSIEEFGVFSAAANLIVIIASLTDLGISSAMINFVSSALSKNKQEKANMFLKAAIIVRFLTVLVFSLIVLVFAPFVAKNLLATNSVSISYWVSVITLGLFFWLFIPYILQAKKRFLGSVVVDLSLGVPRIVIAFVFFYLGGLTLHEAFGSYALSTLPPIIVGFFLIGTKFLKSKPDKKIYTRLIRFSGWLGVNRIISAISGRLDIQMLAVLSGATATGLYSIPARLASFTVVLTSSFSSVLAPRLAGFNDKKKEGAYILKATLAIIPIILGVIVWVIVAEPFIVTLFGDKYLPSVPVFQALALSMIPFIFTAPSVTAIVYALKKPVYIGAFSFFQLIAIFSLNYLFIPKYGPIGPTLTFGIVNTILALYSWIIVIKHYWAKK